ncbi:MAG TPA: hypothetical protein VEH84_04515 [Alphaproteobacteria bacterium]|nr:hypothetical protein [Alphaproteobacteria bacterium]
MKRNADYVIRFGALLGVVAVLSGCERLGQICTAITAASKIDAAHQIISEEVTRLKNELDQANLKLSSAYKEMDEIKNDAKSQIDSASQKISEQVTRLKNELDQSNLKVSSAYREMDEIKNDARTQIESISEKANNEIMELKGEISVLIKYNEEAKREVYSYTEKIRSMDNVMLQKESKINDMSIEIDKLNSKINEYKNGFENMFKRSP